jgi:hypothetical protein
LSRARAALALVLAIVALAQSGCGTCQPGRAPVEPRVGGAIGGGSGGFWNASWLSLDVSNLFCREPRPDTGPASEPDSDGADSTRSAPR